MQDYIDVGKMAGTYMRRSARKLAARDPPFKVTQDHRKQHRSWCNELSLIEDNALYDFLVSDP